MKGHLLIGAAIILLSGACSTTNKNVQVSPSGKYSIRFYEATSDGQADQDSFYQIVNNWNPKTVYSSLGGGTRLMANSVIWSPTEETFVVQENRFGSVRIIYLVVMNKDREAYEIYMRPLEKHFFEHEMNEVASVSDKGVMFRALAGKTTNYLSIKDLISESQRQFPLSENEIHD